MLDSLATVQLPSDDLKKFTSITQVQTKGLKRHFRELEGVTKKRKTSVGGDDTGNQDNKKLCDLSEQIDDDDDSDEDKPERDYSKIGVGDSSDDDSTSEGEDEEEEKALEIEPCAVEKEFIAEKIVKSIPDKQPEKVIESPVEEPVTITTTPPAAEPSKPATYVHVKRRPEIQEARLKLPILSEEQVIMEAINENPIIIIAGETGSGKTTQVPQFLYEAGYAKDQLIAVTEPRRVAAISMAKRVGSEMSLGLDEVSYLIRFEGSTTDQTKIKFMTDGVLLKEIENDFLLSKYSVVILDEAHERSVYTDILLGLLSRIVPLRNKKGMPMKLIIMSATLRVSDFTENRKLFKIPPPVLKVDARQFPVTVHFNKYTDSDYVQEAYRKTVKIHTKLPEGGILIFLTGQQEVLQLVKRLRKSFPMQKKLGGKEEKKKGEPTDETNEEECNRNVSDEDDEFDERPYKQKNKMTRSKLQPTIILPKVNLDSYKLPGDDTEADRFENDDSENEAGHASDDDEDLDEDEQQLAIESTSQPLWVLPLYSLLSSEHQARVFEPPPEGTRLCVVATNVAETSLTIPNIKYVIDSGRQKTRIYDKVTGVSAYVVTYTSKASAQQRAGRAGRTGPGHCYNLYSSAVYNDEFCEFSVPEIQKKPVDDLMLQMKCMGIDRVVNFPFPSPPDSVQLRVAEKKLQLLGALEDTKSEEEVAKVTKLGKAISVFPVAPRFGKMLALSHQHDLLPYTVCLVAALSVQEVFQENANESNPDDEGESKAKKNAKLIEKRLKWAGQGHSLQLGDPMVLLRTVGAAEYANSKGKLLEFCSENGLRHKAIVEIRKLRVQLTNEINLHMPDIGLCVDPEMKPPSDVQAKYLRQIILAGMSDHVARKCPHDEAVEKGAGKKISKSVPYQTPEMEDPIFMSATSVLSRSPPEFVVYQEAYELQIPGTTPKMVMRGLTAIEAEWLPSFAAKQCAFEAVADQKPYYDKTSDRVMQQMQVTFGRSAWDIPSAATELPFGADACRQFGMFILNGEVFDKLKPYQEKLLSTPSSITKSYNKIIPRVDAFIKALLKHQLNSKSSLQTLWKKKPKCEYNFEQSIAMIPLMINLSLLADLLKEYQEWLPEALKAEVAVLWPPQE